MPAGGAGKRTLTDHPARFVVSAFLAAIACGTGLLMLPWSSSSGRSPNLLTALFTSTSAVCVTGLTVVDTGTHWSPFGLVVLTVLVQLGGIGFMTMASLVAMVVSQRLGLRMTLAATTERRTLNLGDVRRVLAGIGVVTLVMEVGVALVLAARFHSGHGYGWAKALSHGTWYSIHAFTNSGLSLDPDSLNGFATDRVITAAVMFTIVIGGLGFPVIVDLYERRRHLGRQRLWRKLSLHSRITLATSAALLVIGFVLVAVFEWGNPETLGAYGTLDKLWLSLFGSVSPRTAGFHTISPAAMTDEGLLGTMGLMFVGAGSAGTSGGIKVGTFAVLVLVVRAELRGDRDAVTFNRRIPQLVQRQAITVVMLAAAVVAVAAVVLLWVTEFPLRDAGFEAVSAFGTTGLSTGVTATLPASGRLLLLVVMLIGRLGPVTLGTALVLRVRTARIRHPEEAPLIG